MASSKVIYVSRSSGTSFGSSSDVAKSDSSNSFNIIETDGSYFADTKKVKSMKNGKFHSTVKSNEADNYNTNKRIDTNLSLEEIVKKINKSISLSTTDDTVQKSFTKTVNYYNRFKMANPNLALQKGFPHVFFVRPSCNLLTGGGKLLAPLENNELFTYAYNNTPEMLKELVTNVSGTSNDFMMSLSNAATSFSLQDEYINSDSYGKTYTGYKVAYGKNNIESKTAGNFTVSYNDDRNLHIYQIHRLWVEYINGVYRGSIAPMDRSIMEKILDYVGAVYYFITAEDGETILFWSKYYGVFPTTIPSSQYSWSAGNVITNPTIDIQYSFSFKEDFNPYTILEFNYNSNIENNGTTYMPVYDKNLGHTGDTWVGSPFIEIIKDDSADCPYIYKLRFRPKE